MYTTWTKQFYSWAFLTVPLVISVSFCLGKGERYLVVVVVGPTPPPKNGGGVQQPFLHTPADGIPHLAGIRTRWSTGGPIHSTSRCPTSTGAVHKSVTFGCVFMLVQLNKCVVVCGSDLQSGDGCLSSSILFKYECSMGHLFVLSWARVRRVALRSVVSD